MQEGDRVSKNATDGGQLGCCYQSFAGGWSTSREWDACGTGGRGACWGADRAGGTCQDKRKKER